MPIVQTTEVDTENPDDSATIRPSSILSGLFRSSPIIPVVEDYSDLVGEEEADPFAGRVEDLRVSFTSALESSSTNASCIHSEIEIQYRSKTNSAPYGHSIFPCF